MEEKERYEWNSPYDSAVRDNKNNDIINAIERLNEQDKRIKELEEENQQLKQQLVEKDKIEYTDTINFVETSEPDIVAKELDRLNEQLAESESKLRVSNSSLASLQLEYNQLKKEYEEQEKLLSEVLANKSRLQFEFDKLKKQLEEKEKRILQLNENLYHCEADRKFEQDKKNLLFKKLKERSEQLKSQPKEIVEKIISKFPMGHRSYGKQLFTDILNEILKEYEGEKNE